MNGRTASVDSLILECHEDLRADLLPLGQRLKRRYSEAGEPATAVRHKLSLNLNQLLIDYLRRDHTQIRMLM